jgi:hypothetical protein
MTIPRRIAARVASASDGVHGPFGPFSRPGGPTVGKNGGVTLRAGPLERDATLPDGRVVHVRVGLPEDGYITPKDLETVTLELSGNGEHLAAVTTILEPAQVDEALVLLRRVVDGLESGELAPTAHAIEPLADTLPT